MTVNKNFITLAPGHAKLLITIITLLQWGCFQDEFLAYVKRVRVRVGH
jgi:hypothetical protein